MGQEPVIVEQGGKERSKDADPLVDLPSPIILWADVLGMLHRLEQDLTLDVHREGDTTDHIQTHTRPGQRESCSSSVSEASRETEVRGMVLTTTTSSRRDSLDPERA